MFASILIVSCLVIVLGTLLFWVQRYKRCPSDKILVIYGKTGGARSSLCIHGGACFVWPVLQSYQWLDLSPIPIDLGVKEFSPNEKDRVKILSKLIAGISTKTGIMENAAERLLGLKVDSIRDLTLEITEGCMRSAVKELGAEAIQSDPDSLVDRLGERLDSVLKEIGLKVINLDVKKIEVNRSETSSFDRDIPEETPILPSSTDEPLPEEEPTDISEDKPPSSHQLS
ncbi:MAG: flotillin family protein [Opitutae bacterium]|nr:flotillin family protein [Opitutae bacterium]